MANKPEIVTVLRLIRYTGPRELVELAVVRAVHGTKELYNGMYITAVTIDEVPQIVLPTSEEVSNG